MSVIRITVVAIASLILIGFAGLAINDIVKTKDKIEFQKVELKSRGSDIQQLNIDYEKLNKDLDRASEQKEADEAEVEALKKEKERLEKERERLLEEVSSLEQRKIAQASERVIRAATATQTVEASAVPESRGVGSYSHAEITAIIHDAAIKHGLDPNWFYRLAECESTWNPNAVNRGYWDNGHPSGLFQHISGYWPQRAIDHGYAGASVFDPVANANVTASMWRTGSQLWECQ